MIHCAQCVSCGVSGVSRNTPIQSCQLEVFLSLGPMLRRACALYLVAKLLPSSRLVDSLRRSRNSYCATVPEDAALVRPEHLAVCRSIDAGALSTLKENRRKGDHRCVISNVLGMLPKRLPAQSGVTLVRGKDTLMDALTSFLASSKKSTHRDDFKSYFEEAPRFALVEPAVSCVTIALLPTIVTLENQTHTHTHTSARV
jgi:hypothetical protein